MSPMDEPTPLSDLLTPVSQAPTSAGQWLRQARERAGLDLGVLSALLKVPVRQLEALEADQYDQLMGTAFVRSLTRTICRHLNVDSKPALDLLPLNDTRLGPVKDSLGAAEVASLGGLFRGRSSSWGTLLVVLCLVGVFVGGALYWQSHTDTDVVMPTPQPMSEPTSVEQPVPPSMVIEPAAVVTTPPEGAASAVAPALQATDSKGK